jgi:hypothetical protein
MGYCAAVCERRSVREQTRQREQAVDRTGKAWRAMFVMAIVGGTGVGLAATGSLTSASADLSGDQADSVEFALGFPEGDGGGPVPMIGDVVYCGVARNAEPYVLDVAVTNPHPENQEFTGHGSAGWLAVHLQGTHEFPGPFDGTRRAEYNVPFNSSYSLSLTLGGRPGRDQMVMMMSPPLGDPHGGGAPLYGYSSVRASRGATDPFTGDDRSDNFCVTIGVDGRAWSEYQEGEISTTLPVPDQWVLDGDGSDGGVLAGMPH